MNGFDNLYAMEIDPNGSLQEMIENCEFRQMSDLGVKVAVERLGRVLEAFSSGSS